MKALTLTQPWASLVDLQKKKLETRSWYTSYRGPLLIHAAKGYPEWARNLAWQPEFRRALGWHLHPEALPISQALCVVRVVACVATTALHKLQAIDFKMSAEEIPFGDFAPGRFAWALEYVRHLEPPVPMRGALGIWNVPEGSIQ